MSNSIDLPKAYDASQVEDALYREWESSGFFNPDKLPDRNQKGEPYCIVMPPPNVTGVLHLGHALENAMMDTMARFQRMRGKRVLLIPGTDHAAIATQAKVEKILIKEGMNHPREELGRDKLVEKIRAFAEESKATILRQIRKLGTSCDWSRLAYTFDETRNRAVKELFVRMYQDGLIYRGYRVVNWSVKGQSTCSDDEIEPTERPAKLYTFKYNTDFPIPIATTRPETKLGDTAVAVHPSDERYRSYIGQTFTVDVGAAKPLSIKIIADEEVDPQFGTGAVGVTPAHSPVDFAMYEKQKSKGNIIDLIPVIGIDGCMTEEAGPGYQGLTVEDARTKFIQWLVERGLLIKEEDIVQAVGTSDRYGDVIESIPLTQWWLSVNKPIPGRGKSLRDLLREAVTDGLEQDDSKVVTILPERIVKEYLNRVDNLRDWCLSRQLWWGHRIPVWHREEEAFAGNEPPSGAGWEQDPDTLDTWFSSGTWTFSTLGWPEKTSDLATYHPTSWIQMGYEIRYLWLMRMILMSAYALQDIPFRSVYMHGMLRDEYGKKFSKSSGNGIDPIEVIDQYGCDALRVSLLLGVTPGNDSRYYTEKIEAGRNFVNKLWNISRFILMQIGEGGLQKGVPTPQTLADQWILSRLAQVTQSVTDKMEHYEFSAAGEELRDFTWGDLADWYLEIAKVEKGKGEILSFVLKTVITLWHPFMPFVTEYIWKSAGAEGMLMVHPWPDAVEMKEIEVFESLRLLVTDLRRLRTEQGIEAAKMVEFALSGPENFRKILESNQTWIERLVRGTIQWVNEIPHGWVTGVSGAITMGLNASAAVNREEEREKLERELEEVQGHIRSTELKLENQEFKNKAPATVVAGMVQKLEEARIKEDMLKRRLQQSV